MSDKKSKHGCLRTGAKFGCLFLIILLVVAAVAFTAVFRVQLYHRFVLFPKQADAVAAIARLRQTVPLDDGWNEYRGVMHSHSEISHDSVVTPEEILQVLKNEQRDFIFMTDHAVDGKADYSLGWKGLHDGVLFVRGYELDDGFMPWGLPDDTVLLKSENSALLAKTIIELGGVLFFAHCEEDRPYYLNELTGMEIYNIHTDVKDESLRSLILDYFFSHSAYHDQILRTIFDRQTKILAKWDELNKTRDITGIAANDAHQNSGFRGMYTPEGNLVVYDTGHELAELQEDDLTVVKLNFLTRNLLRLFFGPLEPNRQVFRFDLDPYNVMVRYVATHILAKELSEPALLDSLREGRVFIAFESLADARGFLYIAESAAAKAVIGETIPLAPDLRLAAASPVVCKFILVHDGQVVTQQNGNVFAYTPAKPGKYRLEAELEIAGEWFPWIYTNPITVAP